MFCTLEEYRVLQGSFYEASSNFEERVTMQMVNFTGLKGYLILTDPYRDVVILTIWDTVEHLEKWAGSNEEHKIIEQLVPQVMEKLKETIYEVQGLQLVEPLPAKIHANRAYSFDEYWRRFTGKPWQQRGRLST